MNKINYLPKSLILYITYNCGSLCSHCFLTQKKLINSSQLELDDIIKVIEDAQNSKVFLIPITGGEPLLHPNFFEIVYEVKKRNMLPLLGTSSAQIDKNLAGEIEKSGISCVQLSLDSYEENFHDSIRGQGSYQKTITNIQNLKSTKLKIVVAICVNVFNYLQIEKLIHFLYSLEVDSIKFQFYRSYENTIEHELTREQINYCVSICKRFMDKISNENFINITKQNRSDRITDVQAIHNESISIGANGNIYIGNAERKIGHINHGKVSEQYNNFLKSFYV